MTALIVLALGLGVAKPALAAKKLFVGNLPYATTAADVEDLGGQPITANVKRVLVVGSKVKEVIREAGLRSDGELVQAVSDRVDRVHELLAAAIKRCTSNGRSTVRPYDL
jgi:hypothetical protein